MGTAHREHRDRRRIPGRVKAIRLSDGQDRAPSVIWLSHRRKRVPTAKLLRMLEGEDVTASDGASDCRRAVTPKTRPPDLAKVSADNTDRSR